MTIFQKPNFVLIIAAIGFAISTLTGDEIHNLANVIFIMAIIIWAYEESATGVNLFRKLLGATVLLFMAISLYKQLQ